MKKLGLFFFAALLAGGSIIAKPVKPETAMLVAQNFYVQTTGRSANTMVLVYTALSSNNAALYYAYNINNGFVIISADDAAQPVIGYSTEGNFVIPEAGTTIGTWLKKRGEEITYIQEKNIPADSKISQKWNRYFSSSANRQYSTISVSSAGPLCTTTWNQSPGYNALCPGGSVTGCVATAMAQIMKYWNYPATGNGSSSYMSNYGTLSCNYGATTYNWANMGNYIVGSNYDIALISYHCGVSVEMNYSPSGSGAWVCSFDNPVCAQNSYINYFRYDPATIQGLPRSNYDDSTWISIMKNDIDLGRPIQYVGWDPNNGGHTWVCDGYDANNFLHMNWGWGGQSNGYFFLDNMNGGGYNFSDGHEAVIGIVPIAAYAVDAAVPAVTNPNGYFCTNNFTPSLKVQNMGSSVLNSCTINYQIDGGSVQSLPWTGSLVTGQFATVNLPSFVSTPGTHTLVCSTTNPNGGADGNTSNDQYTAVFHVSGAASLPVMEGFENGSLAPSDWTLMNNNMGNNFAVTTNAAATGTHAIMIDNFTNAAGSNSVLQTTSNYDLAAYSSPTLTFKMAYRQRTTADNDKLQVFVSTDCGANWLSRWAHWSSSLSTVSGVSTTPFVPSPTDFMTYTVNLNSVANSHSVIFRWQFFAGANAPGNNLYIDDINITNGVTGMQSINTNNSLELFPNPSTGNFNVTVNTSENSSVAFNVTDMLGRTVESVPARNFPAGEINASFGSKIPYGPGIYFVNAIINGRTISKKLVVQ